MRWLRLTETPFLVAVWVWLGIADGRADQSPDFESQVAPLLIKRCVECHQGDDPSGGLSLTTREGLSRGGESGDVIEPRDDNVSHLLERVLAGEMPPPQQGRPRQLPEAEIKVLRQWLRAGAPWPDGRELDYFERTNALRAGRDWWSLQPIVRPPVPEVPTADHPIDAFIRAKLEAAGISPAPEADRRTLIRRLYFDLLGLPPSVQEINKFVGDEDPRAWTRLVDRLLASPRYGERWGRYWLDLARYADTSGYERDQEKPFAWKYRDWVIAAFNDDLPFRRFVIEQLAGDELPDRSKQSVIATGFLRLGTWNDEPNDQADYQYERLEDLVHTTSSAFLALTVKCARCHAHKFDAITQEDYYRMASAFWPGPIAPGRARNQLGGPSANELGYPDVLGWTDVMRHPPALHRLKNGERNQPLEAVAPASLSAIPTLYRQFDSPSPNAPTTQRRLALANWIADPRHPLTARVVVNRLWQHHFGKGIVRTPNNFGFLADPPTHPPLLDWLAAEFLARGGRMKPIHRLILTSQTWRQSALHPHAAVWQRQDPTNRSWWRAERRRLDAESLRDTLLRASGELEFSMGGPGFKPTISEEALEGLSRKSLAWNASPPAAQRRRTIYMHLKRGLLPPMMSTFDLCDPTLTCGQRTVTTVATQALAMLNNELVHERSLALARTIARQTGDRRQQVGRAWESVLGREPSERERQRAIRHLATQATVFSNQDAAAASPRDLVGQAAGSLVLHLRGDQAEVAESSDRVATVIDLSGQAHHATQDVEAARPALRSAGIGGRPTLIFDGNGRFLKLNGQLLSDDRCTIFAVIHEERGRGHREVISNWNGAAGNSTSSLFLGLTSQATIRFSDAFSATQPVSQPSRPFLLTAINGKAMAAIFQNGKRLHQQSRLPGRRLDTAWVIGQQGNIGGEYWCGGIAEVRVYDRELADAERVAVERQLARRYGLQLAESHTVPASHPELFALASLCHVLMNSNEFLYID